MLSLQIVDMEGCNVNSEAAECTGSFSKSIEGNFFQSSAFRKVLQKIGWKTISLRFSKSECQASVLSFAAQTIPVYHLVLPCYRVFYGPCMHTVGRNIDPVTLDSLLKNLCSTVEQYGAVSLEVRTPFPFPYGSEIFLKNGFVRQIVKGEYSVLIDLREDLDTLWRGMNRFARRSVKKAIEKGVKVRGVETEMELRQFYRTYMETSARRGFYPYPFRLFEVLWRQLEPNGMVKFFIAWWRKKPIAGILNTFYKEESVPYISCSLNRFWNLHPNHLLFWQSIKWSKEVTDSTIFKLYHVPSQRERVRGIDYYTFKTCFGGRLVEECAFYFKILSQAKFSFFQVINKWSKVGLTKNLCSQLLSLAKSIHRKEE